MIRSALIFLNAIILSLITPIEGPPGSWLRFQYYKRRLRRCGGNFFSGAGFVIESPRLVSIGKNCSFNRGILIAASGKIEIGDNVLIGPYSILRDANHAFTSLKIPINQQGHVAGEIQISDDVWVGSHCVILKDVKIGAHSIIAAHSLINKNVPRSQVWGGVPARQLKTRENHERS